MTTPEPDEARRRMLAAVLPLSCEGVELSHAVGRTLRAPVIASRMQPPFAASSMDGWAIQEADFLESSVLTIAGESAAGRSFERSLLPGQAVRISTGAPLPRGADRVVPQENVDRDGDTVRLSRTRPNDPRYVRPAGLDFSVGAQLLASGERLDPWAIALAAAAGCSVLEVSHQARVRVVTLGDELVVPGGKPSPNQIFDAAAQALCSLVHAWGGSAEHTGPVADAEAALAEAFLPSGEDLLVVMGGASVGDHDLVKPVLKKSGLHLYVEGINVRPGRPTWFGRLPDGRLVLGLPGNPASALVCATLFLEPVLNAMHGAAITTPNWSMARLSSELPSNGPREHYLRSRLRGGDDGILRVQPFEDQDSSRLVIFAAANGLVRRMPHAVAAAPEDLVQVLLLPRLGPG
jgi:molybdopterin molybdotransferase